MSEELQKKRVNYYIVDVFEGEENINELESAQSKDRLKEIALIIPCKKVVEQNYLSMDEQMNIWIPKALRAISSFFGDQFGFINLEIQKKYESHESLQNLEEDTQEHRLELLEKISRKR